MDWKNCEPPRPGRIVYTPDVQCTWVGVKPVHAGLVNTGNTCFLNSVLQALFHLPAFVKFLDNDKTHRLQCFSLLNCLVCSLYRTYLNMSIHSSFRPTGLINVLPRINPLLKRGRQEDADEFLVSLLTKIQEELIQREGGPKVLDFCSQQTTAIGKIFGWWARSSKKCVDCGQASETYEPLSSIHVSLSSSIQSAINEVLDPQEYPRVDYQCSKSCATKTASQTVQFHTYPKVLRLGLKRFDNKGVKIHSPIIIDKTIIIKDGEYSFVSAILHQGEYATTGHYTCLALRPDGRTVNLNDNEVSDAKGRTGLESQQVRSSVYIVFYQLRYLKVHSIKRGHPVTPSKALSPLKKKVHVISPYKKSIEKKKKKFFTFSPKKYKRKLGNVLNVILPRKYRKDDEGGMNTLAKPLVDANDNLEPALVPPSASSQLDSDNAVLMEQEKSLQADVQLDETSEALLKPRVEPIRVQRRRRLFPPSTSSQSENDYSIIKRVESDYNKGPSEILVDRVKPLVIHRRQKLFPPSSSSQSSNDYSIGQTYSNLGEDDKDSEATAEAQVSPIIISKKAIEKKRTSSSQSHESNVSRVVEKDCHELACTEEFPVSPQSQSHPKDVCLELRDHDYCGSEDHLIPELELTSTYVPPSPQFEESHFLGTDFHENVFDMNNNNPPQSPFEKEYWDECFDKTRMGIDSSPGHVSPEKKGVIDSIKPQFVPVHITPADVPGAELPQPVLEKNSVGDLRTWLKLRSIPTKGNKTELINKVKNCIAMGKDTILDPKIGGGKIYEEKRKELMLSQDVAHLSDDDVFPHSGWAPFPSRDMPTNFNFGSVHHYLVETMPRVEDILNTDEDSSDDEALEVMHIADPFEGDERIEIRHSKKLRRGLQYVKSGFVRNVYDCLPDKLHCYKGQIRASMKLRAYSVKLCISQMSGFILKCVCDDICPQGTLGRCSHVSALLLHLLIHKSLNGPYAISCTSKPCTWNRGSLQRDPGIAALRQYDSFKINVQRRSTFDPRPTKFQGVPGVRNMNNLLCLLSYKEKPCLFQQVASIRYEDFVYDDEDEEILRESRERFIAALKTQTLALKPNPLHTGPFEVLSTKDQSSSPEWYRIRALHCSAQPSRQVEKFKSDEARKNFLRRRLWGMDAITTKGMAYGRRSESYARKKYKDQLVEMDPNAVVEECGLCLNTEVVGLSCSPDGIVIRGTGQRALLEIKTLYSLREQDPSNYDQILPKKKLGAFFLKRDCNGNIELKENHAYYDQVQFSMGLLGLEECDFFVWTPVNNLTLKILFNEDRWLALKKSSLQFHWEYLTIEYFARRTPRQLVPWKLE